MNDLFQLMIELAMDPRKQEAFQENSSEVTETLKPSEANSLRFKSGNRAEINAAIEEELGTDEFISVMGSCIVLDPGPDPTPDPDPAPEPDDNGKR